MKPFVLTTKEIRRSSEGVTAVVRRQAKNGLFMVAMVRVASGRPVFRPRYVALVDVARTIAEEVRMLSKLGMGGPMAQASRARNFYARNIG